MKKIVTALYGLLMAWLIAGCGASTPLQETPGLAPAMPGVARESWQIEWEKALSEARKEGKLVAYMWVGPSIRQAISKAFTDKYGIVVETLGGSGAELAQKVLREIKASIFNVDLMVSGTGTLVNSLKPASVLEDIEPYLILLEVKDPSLWYEGKLPFMDKENLILSMMKYPGGGKIAINSEMASKEELKLVRDYLNPKWKGKIDIRQPGETYFNTLTEEWEWGRPERIKKIREILGPVLR